jgi:HAD superfamily hydrolase (TIGR01450 family)
MTKEISTEVLKKIAKVRCWLLDMDGTVSLEDDALPGADIFFRAIHDQEFIFLTNNSSRHADYYVKRMLKLGFNVDRKRMLTSTDALIIYLKKKNAKSLFIVGTPDFERSLVEAGFDIKKDKGMSVDYVEVGFDTTLTYEKIDTACDYIRSGIPWVGANPDFVCPLADGKVLPDCGSIMAMLTACTDSNPEIVIGKPESARVDMVIADRGYKLDELAMVGDRLYTDLELARRAGILGVAVLTGETSLVEIAESNIKPDIIMEDIGQLANIIETIKKNNL